MLLTGALTKTNPVVEGTHLADLSIGNFLEVLANQNVHLALINSLVACSGGTFLAVVIGLAFAWIVVRTNTPCKALIAGTGMLPLFIPPLVAGVAWAILGSPRTGLLNTVLDPDRHRRNDQPLLDAGDDLRVRHLLRALRPTCSPPRRCATWTPRSRKRRRSRGPNPLRTLLTVTFPLILPAIVSGALLSFVVMLGIYGIPAVLGTPANIPVLTTYIFALTAWSPPLFNTAAAVAVILMIVTGALVALQQKVISGRSYTTVAGKAFRPRTLNLGPWRFVTLGLAIAYLLVVVVLPSLALIVAAFRKFMFIRDLTSLFDMKQYSWIHFQRLFDNPLTITSIINTMKVGVITALVGGILAFAIGYTVTRTRAPGRRAVDVIATIPVAIPGLVIGVAYLWAWIGLPGGLYGTLWILALAFVARFIPDTVKALSTSLMQIHRELEEASWICGRGLLGTIGSIVLPLARPGVVAAMTLLFILAIRELGSSLFLYSSGTIVMAVQLLGFYEGGNISVTAAFSLVQMVILAVLITLTDWLSRGTAGGSVGRAG